jgi:hypothetical protein
MCKTDRKAKPYSGSPTLKASLAGPWEILFMIVVSMQHFWPQAGN